MECGFFSNLNPETEEMQVCKMSIHISQITRIAIEGQLLWIRQVNQVSEDAVLPVKELSNTRLFFYPLLKAQKFYTSFKITKASVNFVPNDCVLS